jgi:GT2 family glycosyltransferase
VRPPPFGAPVPGNGWERFDRAHAPQLRTVSVVVVHHDQDRQLTRTLTALQRQHYPRDRLEVIVVDDGSRHVPEVPEGVRLLRQERRGARRSAARNRGARASQGEILCFLDADTAPEPEYIQLLTRLPSLTPEAVVVGRRRHARLDAVDLAADVTAAGPEHELPAPGWLHDGYAATRNLRDAGPRDFRFVISAVLGCTRWFFDELGGFDEKFVSYGGEDWEWAHRAWLDGAIFAHVPAAVAWHDGPDWAAREVTDRRAEKNTEAMRLAQLITADGHRPRGLFGRRAPIVVELPAELAGPVAFICLDSLLEALPRATVRVPNRLTSLFADDPRVVPADDPVGELLRWPQLRIAVHGPVRVLGRGLAALCDAMINADADAEAGICHVGDEDGVVMTIETARHRARIDHWGLVSSRVSETMHPDWLQRLPPTPDVEAYLGGWDDR